MIFVWEYLYVATLLTEIKSILLRLASIDSRDSLAWVTKPKQKEKHDIESNPRRRRSGRLNERFVCRAGACHQCVRQSWRLAQSDGQEGCSRLQRKEFLQRQGRLRDRRQQAGSEPVIVGYGTITHVYARVTSLESRSSILRLLQPNVFHCACKS